MGKGKTNQDGHTVLRFASLLLLMLLSLAAPALADGSLDLGTISSKTDITQEVRRLATEQSSIRVELPPDSSGKSDVLDLKPWHPAAIQVGHHRNDQQGCHFPQHGARD